jgi:hypothetical protein
MFPRVIEEEGVAGEMCSFGVRGRIGRRQVVLARPGGKGVTSGSLVILEY